MKQLTPNAALRLIRRKKHSRRQDLLDIISTSPETSFHYFRDIFGKFDIVQCPECIASIATSAKWSFGYAIEILKGPFILGEAAISSNANWLVNYIVHIPNVDIQSLLPKLKELDNSVYNDYVLRGVVPELRQLYKE